MYSEKKSVERKRRNKRIEAAAWMTAPEVKNSRFQFDNASRHGRPSLAVPSRPVLLLNSVIMLLRVGIITAAAAAGSSPTGAAERMYFFCLSFSLVGQLVCVSGYFVLLAVISLFSGLMGLALL